MAEKLNLEKYRETGQHRFVVRIDPEVEDAVDQALALLDDNKVELAESRLSELSRLHPDLYVTQYGMGALLAMQGNLPEAVAYFDRCLTLFPYCVEAWYNKGIAHRQLLDISNMLKSMRKVVELGEPELDCVTEAQRLLAETGQMIFRNNGLSIDDYLRSAEEFDRAFAYLRDGRHEKALAGFQRVLKINHNHQQSYGNIGLCHALLGRREEALAAFDRALEIDPDYQPARLNRLVVLSQGDGKNLLNNREMIETEYYKDCVKAPEKNLFRRILSMTRG